MSLDPVRSVPLCHPSVSVCQKGSPKPVNEVFSFSSCTSLGSPPSSSAQPEYLEGVGGGGVSYSERTRH